jgi:hypothetical protein
MTTAASGMITRSGALWLAVAALSCAERGNDSSHARTDAIASASQEMSGPSLLSKGRLAPALAQLREKAAGKLLRLEVGPREVVMQAEDLRHPGSVVELHYRDGKLSEPEHATLRGKGQLSDNLFDLSDVRWDGLADLTRVAVERVDPEHGSVDLVLVRKNLPETEDVRVRVYVKSPRQSGYVDADRNLLPL